MTFSKIVRCAESRKKSKLPSAGWITLLVLIAMIIGLAISKWPSEMIALGSVLILVISGVISPNQAIEGFSNSTVILVGALLVVAEAIDATGVSAWITSIISSRTGSNSTYMLLVTMAVVALLGIMISTTGAVAAFIPGLVMTSKHLGIPPSATLIPVLFAAKTGSLLVVIGSPINVVVAHAIQDSGARAVGFFDFALVGAPLLALTIVILLITIRWLPHRQPAIVPIDLSGHGETLAQHYGLDHVIHLRVTADSVLAGAQITDEMLLGRRFKLMSANHYSATRWSRVGRAITPGELLTAIGDRGSIEKYAEQYSLDIVDQHSGSEPLSNFFDAHGGIVEVMVPPRSRYVQQQVKVGQQLFGTDVTVLAAHRFGHELDLPAKLHVGDTLLVEGSWESLEATSVDPDVLLVDAPVNVRRQAVKLGRGSFRAIGILSAMVVVMAAGLLSAALAALAAAGMIMITRVISPQDVYQRIQWSAVFLVAGMLPVSAAIKQSGLADWVAHAIECAEKNRGPTMLLVTIFVTSVFFSQFLTGNVTALIMVPIAISTAATIGVSQVPVLVCVLIACTASFLTPTAGPANPLVMGPGGYRVTDYVKIGLPLTMLFFLAAVFYVPMIWSF
ncbi:SLC13 family permease [Mycobacterium attenuatum]|uniref:SLC13 family permease n=1 Tax=Mycobacterium attenuatum TaxID=2341086 RepID=UPI000F02C552|nr:SLC13 family permease [Mycobacterium attenuatum]VBA45065.1 L-tartrate/succinate antiporter [Mycobacterium attenuatum]